MRNKKKITVVGSGYVGMSLAVLLAQNNDVTVLDIDPERVNKINNKNSTVVDIQIERFLSKKKLSLTATLNKKRAYKDSNFIVIATPTNYDPVNHGFDTSSVDSVVKDALEISKEAILVIKSTIPVGYTKSLTEKYRTDRIIFSPEFLREGSALYDNLYPSRIIIGGHIEAGQAFLNLLLQNTAKKDVDTFFMNSTEAEAVKLFSNTYLAMRVSFFNELDSFALSNDLNTNDIINGVCSDIRISQGYNNPSFGYGGYCLPKDTKQLLANYKKVPQSLIQAIVASNKTRKEFIASEIVNRNPKTVGFYRLVMKEGSDNIRSSAIIDVLKRIKAQHMDIIIYEPILDEKLFFGIKVLNNLEEFKQKSNLIVANRIDDLLADVYDKVFSRDLFREN